MCRGLTLDPSVRKNGLSCAFMAHVISIGQILGAEAYVSTLFKGKEATRKIHVHKGRGRKIAKIEEILIKGKKIMIKHKYVLLANDKVRTKL